MPKQSAINTAINTAFVLIGVLFIVMSGGGDRVDSLTTALNPAPRLVNQLASEASDGVYQLEARIRPGLYSNVLEIPSRDGPMQIETNVRSGRYLVTLEYKSGFAKLKSVGPRLRGWNE